MGWNNPPIRWREFERRLSGRQPGEERPGEGRSSEQDPSEISVRRVEGGRPYYELHCHSNFSFLDGASHPEELAYEAARLGLPGLALTDHDGMYGVVRFYEAADEAGISTLFGAELSLGLSGPQAGVADPEGTHLLVLARDEEGYRRLCRAISAAQLVGEEKGKPVYPPLEELAALGGDRWLVLTGCRKGLVPSALATDGAGEGLEAAARALDELVALFGREGVAVELWDHGDPLDSARNDALAELAARAGVPAVATGNVHYATPARARLAAALAAVRARRSLDEMDGWLPVSGGAYLRSGEEMECRFARYPGAVDAAAALGRECAFPLKLVAPKLPRFPVPEGRTEVSYLRKLTEEGARERYGPRGAKEAEKAYQQIDHELKVIEDQGYPGYFLIVWEIAKYCREKNILCQGRGSAANSAVCYALGITAVDAVRHELFFERFLSPERDGPPDIDLDIESDRREEVIQHVYDLYGRQRAAQVANVISYRPKMAVRDMARALGYPPGQQDAWSKRLDSYEKLRGQTGHDVPEPVMELAGEVLGFPRHLGIHSGGMVLCERPVTDVCPVEWARMPGRTVLQWDKDDCAAMNLVKFDLLGLGMLTALHEAFDMIAEHHGDRFTLETIPEDDRAVYEMLCAGDAVGVFQVESRAQLATLPRLRPERFYDLVVEVAIIRPGPIQGGSVHPYIRRRNGQEEPDVPHPLLKNALDKTYGVPLFQEQLMQIAVDAAGFSPADSDKLRQALSSKRSAERLARLRPRLLAGMAKNGITPEVAEGIYEKLIAFADFGFPESHAVSFALLVYASAYLKRYYPAAFTCALLRAQPMGFYSPQSLVADARRHGVEIRGPDLNASAAKATLEPSSGEPGESNDQPAIRLGLSSVRGVGEKLAERIAADRPYRDMRELVRRHKPSTAVVEALATAGAFDCLGLDRRSALWAAGAVGQDRAGHLPIEIPGAVAPALPEMTDQEQAIADLWATRITPGSYPTQFFRDRLDELGAVSAAALRATPDGSRVLSAGIVTHRQRPPTAGGVVFINLEDETGHINVICPPATWERNRGTGRDAAALLVSGRVENHEGVTNLLADRLWPFPVFTAGRSRDFR
ncbi:MAG: DNA polymerase III subunit alpha [Streptosporangiales bacterium]|nr:DNA polymerase III subunit alpha [Streptosporangiales bacterium]